MLEVFREADITRVQEKKKGHKHEKNPKCCAIG